MANDGKIIFEVTVDDQNVIKSMKDITKTIDSESKKWDKDIKESFDDVGDHSNTTAGIIDAAFEGCFMSISASIIGATGQILSAFADWALAAIDMASDLEEVQNVVDVTFGESGAKKIDDWSKKAASQFGLTELQAKKFSSTLGAMMKSSGMTGDEVVTLSEDLAGLAADMASFYNLDFDTAFAKIRAGMSGETEPLRQLGIDMSVDRMNTYLESIGSETKFNDLSSAEKYLTRYQVLMEQTALAQGDFVRTSVDSYANLGRQIETQSQQLQTNLGEAMLPIAKQWRQDWLNFMKLLNGDTGVAITGSKNQLTQWMNEQSAAAEQARKNLDELADTYGILTGFEREDFEAEPNAFYKSYGEYVLATLQTQQPFAGGRTREQIDAAVSAMEGEAAKITEAEAKVADYQKQLDQLATEAPDGTQAGSDVVSSIVAGMASQEGNLQAEVDVINSILSGIKASVFSTVSSFIVPQHATGLNFVPFDGYLASLHAGEGILTAEENRVWQRFKSGQGSAIDYDQMGGVMRDNIKAGGNVYLDGKVVGSVISDIQGRSYRQLQRSGWQS